jgi:hypothetical protein
MDRTWSQRFTTTARTLRYCEKRRVIGDHADDEIPSTTRLGNRWRRQSAGLDKVRGFGDGAIKYDQIVAAPKNPRRHRLAHTAEPYKSYFQTVCAAHQCPPEKSKLLFWGNAALIG